MMRVKIFLICLLPLWAMGQDNPWTVQDVVNQSSISDAAFGPDRVVWVKRRPAPKKDRFVTDLWVSLLDKQDPNQPEQLRSLALTRDDAHSDRNPVLPGQGETLYYLSSARKGKCLWAISMLGGAPYVVDSFPARVSQLRVWNDSTLLFTMREGQTWYEQQQKKKKDNVVVVEDTAHFPADRVFAYDLKRKKRRRLTNNQDPIRGYAASTNGRWLVTGHTRSPHFGADGKPSPRFFLWDLNGGTRTRILADLQSPGGFQFTTDNKGFFFSATQSSDPEWGGSGIELLYYYEVATGEYQRVDDSAWGIGRGVKVWQNTALANMAQGPIDRLFHYQPGPKGWSGTPVAAGKWTDHLSILALSPHQDLALISYSTASQPTQYHVVSLEPGKKNLALSEQSQLPNVNPQLKGKQLARTEVVNWTGGKEEAVSGILYYPHDYQAGKRYPLMVAIHGGPSGVDRDRWSDRWAYYHNLLAQKGCFILKPNYHGSSNHGQDFVESIKGHYYDLEIPDILAGIDSLDEAGLILRDSMGVMGWSNGAILTTMLTVRHPDLFRVAAAGAGDVNWTSDFGTCQFGVTFDQSYFIGAPWDDTDSTFFNPNYLIKSPLFELEKVKTPTLICHGSEDRAVPRDQGWEYYRALQQVGEAPVRFLWFPGQPHGLQKLTHQRRKMEEELRWFDHYLFHPTDSLPGDNPVKPGSPLASLQQKGKWQQHDGMYGLWLNNRLLPQLDTVKADSIAIGMFEVTHAQYQQYQPEHAFPRDAYNHPVVGLSQVEVADYLTWLAGVSGWAVRLPNAAEAEALHRIAVKQAAKENTLRYWAGYDLTLDEVPALQAKLAQLEVSPLLSVGQFAPAKVGKAKLYDLGGNAAEYGAQGHYGYGADEFADPANEGATESPRWLGFRVVVDLKE